MILHCLQKALQGGQLAVAGEAQMVDTSCFLLLDQVFHNAIFRIQETVNIIFKHAMEQIEIKVIHPAFFQLGFKDFLFDLGAAIAAPLFSCIGW